MQDAKQKNTRMFFPNIRVKSYRIDKLESSLSLCNESCESGLIGDSDLREHLAVQGYAGLLQAVHELRIVDAVDLSFSRDTGDPKSSEISLLELSAGECIVTALHNGLFRHLEVLALRAPIALCCL